MARIAPSDFRKLRGEFPSYVTDEDADLSEFDLLYAICTRQRDDKAASGTVQISADLLSTLVQFADERADDLEELAREADDDEEPIVNYRSELETLEAAITAARDLLG